MAKNKPTKIISKKHLARQERERRQTRAIVGSAIGIVTVIVLLIAYGLLRDTLFLYLRPAVTVNGESLTMHEFQVRVRAERQQMIYQYEQYAQYIQWLEAYGFDVSSDTQLTQTLTQISGQLDTPSIIGSQIIDVMIDDLLIRQYAEANGITVSEADIEQSIQEALDYYPSGTPTSSISPTQLIYSTLNATQWALMTSTTTPTSSPTMTPTEAVTFTPTLTPELTSTATSVPSLTPTVTPYTLEGFESQYKTGLENYSQMGLSESDFRRIFYEFELYQERVKAIVTADVGHEQDQAWVRHILVADEDTAANIREQLLAGADFSELAAQSSLDTNTKDLGGDLGWLGYDSIYYGTSFADAAFSLNTGEISQPIESTYGYHILQVLGHEVRPLTEQEYDDAVTAAFNTWLDEQRANATIDINGSWTDYTPSSPTITEYEAEQAAAATAYVQTYLAGTTTTP